MTNIDFDTESTKPNCCEKHGCMHGDKVFTEPWVRADFCHKDREGSHRRLGRFVRQHTPCVCDVGPALAIINGWAYAMYNYARVSFAQTVMGIHELTFTMFDLRSV